MNTRDQHRHVISRSLYAAALRYDGLTLREIGTRFGIGVERDRHLVMRGERLFKNRYSALNAAADMISRVDTTTEATRDE